MSKNIGIWIQKHLFSVLMLVLVIMTFFSMLTPLSLIQSDSKRNVGSLYTNQEIRIKLEKEVDRLLDKKVNHLLLELEKKIKDSSNKPSSNKLSSNKHQSKSNTINKIPSNKNPQMGKVKSELENQQAEKETNHPLQQTKPSHKKKADPPPQNQQAKKDTNHPLHQTKPSHKKKADPPPRPDPPQMINEIDDKTQELSPPAKLSSDISKPEDFENCEEESICIYLPESDFLGGDIRYTHTDSKEDCCNECNKDVHCGLWTHVDDICYLKYPHLKKVSKQGAWAGRSCKPTPAPTPPTPGPTVPPPPDREKALESITRAIKHAWRGYSDNCFGRDEYLPVSGACHDAFDAGLTLIDSLDTLKLAGFEAEFRKGQNWVEESLKLNTGKRVSFFETVIRVLGGLISSYDLSGNQIFIDRAVEVANALNPVFNSPKGLPFGQIVPNSGAVSGANWAGKSSILAEVGTIQLEYYALSERTGDNTYRDKAQHVIDHLDNLYKQVPGLYPLFINPNTGEFANSKISFGGCGDSFYEYLLKMWLLTGRSNNQYKRMYRESMDGLIKSILTTNTKGMKYLPTLDGGFKKREMEHLTCFAPGMLALGSISGILESKEEEARHLSLAKDLCHSCYMMYATTTSKLGPENANFDGGGLYGINVKTSTYHLRPETVESIFYLWRVTGNSMYRDWGWQIFDALERNCKMPSGYAGLRNVNSGDHSSSNKLDKMESFFIAETLKYMFLLFDDDINTLPLAGIDDERGTLPGDFYVFNTEAHPIKAWKTKNAY